MFLENTPRGHIKWFVTYYGGLSGVSIPTHWKVRVKSKGKAEVIEGQLNQIGARSRSYDLKIE